MKTDDLLSEAIEIHTREDIYWIVRYSEQPQYDLQNLYSRWWNKRKSSPRYLKQGRDYWKQRFFGLAAQLKGEIEMYARGRCPHCGCRLKATRCLGCDLKAELKARKEMIRGN